MARPVRFEASGAVYHVMARGEGGKNVFEDEIDRKVWLERLGEVCGSYGWRVHAYVLMGNDFHLLPDTPEPNLVAGMKWFMGVFCPRSAHAMRHGRASAGTPSKGCGTAAGAFPGLEPPPETSGSRFPGTLQGRGR